MSFTIGVSDPDRVLEAGATAPAYGRVHVDGLFVTYTPERDYAGADRFVVFVRDGEPPAVEAAVDVSVLPTADIPFAKNDVFAAVEDTPFVTPLSNLLANDGDADGDPLSVVTVGAATNGTVSLDPSDVTFVPLQHFAGTASFEYTISDGNGTATAEVRLVVGGSNDAPIAGDDSVEVSEDAIVTIPVSTFLANDHDIDGQTLTLSSVTPGPDCFVLHGGSSLSLRPAQDFVGVATFEYTVSDGVSTSQGTVYVNVNGVDDAPRPRFDSFATDEDQPIQFSLQSLLANDIEVDGDPLTLVSLGPPSGGTLTVNGDIVTFTPAPNFYGAVGFEYTVSDGSLTGVGSVGIDIKYVNDAPIAADDVAATLEDTQLVVSPGDLVANDDDIDCCNLVVASVGSAINGTVQYDGSNVRFTPAKHFAGTASFEYTVSDGALTDTATVVVSVAPVDDPPEPQFEQLIATEDTPLEVATSVLLANDLEHDGSPLAITGVRMWWGAGSVSLASGVVTFTPAHHDDSRATIEYTVTDGALEAVMQVAIEIQPVNDPPVANDDVTATTVDTPLVISDNALMGNDQFIDIGPWIFVGVSNATNGTATYADGMVTFTPAAGFVGQGSFDYTISDGEFEDTATVTVTVNP